MSDEIQIPETDHGLMPSNSTAFSAIGAFMAATVVFVFHFNGIDFPAGYEALMGGAFTAAAGYLPKSGRRPK